MRTLLAAVAASLLSVSPASAALVLRETGRFTDYDSTPMAYRFQQVAGRRYTATVQLTPRSEVANAVVSASGCLYHSGITPVFCDPLTGPAGCRNDRYSELQDLKRVGDNRFQSVIDVDPTFTFDSQALLYWGLDIFLTTSGDDYALGFPIDYTVTINDDAVPEPATWAMMIGGFGLVGAAARRRARPTGAVALG